MITDTRTAAELTSALKSIITEEYTTFSEPLGSLDLLVQAQALLDDLIAVEVIRARAERGTWEQVGAALGVTKQAAQQRYRGSAFETRPSARI